MLCAYVEPGENDNEAEVTEKWVREMCRLAKLNARVFVGNVRPPRARTPRRVGGRLVPEAAVGPRHRRDAAGELAWEAKATDWGVDDVRIVPLTDALSLALAESHDGRTGAILATAEHPRA